MYGHGPMLCWNTKIIGWGSACTEIKHISKSTKACMCMLHLFVRLGPPALQKYIFMTELAGVYCSCDVLKQCIHTPNRQSSSDIHTHLRGCKGRLGTSHKLSIIWSTQYCRAINCRHPFLSATVCVSCCNCKLTPSTGHMTSRRSVP